MYTRIESVAVKTVQYAYRLSINRVRYVPHVHDWTLQYRICRARYMCSELEALSTEVSSEANYDTMRERDHLREHLQNLKYL